MPTIPGMENINWLGMFSQVIRWIGRIILGVGITVGLYIAYLYMQYNVKATVFKLHGSGKDGVFSFTKPKSNRVKWIRHRTSWKKMWPLMNRKELEPFDDEYIYPGNRIFAFELNNEWIPARINLEKGEDKIRADLSPVPYYVRNWQSLEHRKNAEEFREHTFWDDNKHLIMAVISVGICCVFAGVVIYFTYQYAGGGRESMDTLSKAISGLTQRAGGVPPG